MSFKRPAPPFNGGLRDADPIIIDGELRVTPLWSDSFLAEESLDADGSYFAHHPTRACEPPCPIHRPGEHHMVTWPLCVIRRDSDESIDLGRRCEHGTLHLDPDSLHGKDHTWECACGCRCCALPTPDEAA